MAKHETVISQGRDIAAGVLVVQGVVAALFGIAALFWPGITAQVFIYLFGIFVLAWGLVSMIHSFLGIGRPGLWWVETMAGVLLLGVGVYLLRNPVITAEVIIMLVGFTLLVRGVVDGLIGIFARERQVSGNRWFYILMGVLGIIAGIIVLSHPVASGLVFIWALGLYLLLYGALNIGLAFRVRGIE